jgi:hypothetical protein
MKDTKEVGNSTVEGLEVKRKRWREDIGLECEAGTIWI